MIENSLKGKYGISKFFSKDPIEGELAWFVTALPICVWLVAPPQMYNFLIFAQTFTDRLMSMFCFYSNQFNIRMDFSSTGGYENEVSGEPSRKQKHHRKTNCMYEMKGRWRKGKHGDKEDLKWRGQLIIRRNKNDFPFNFINFAVPTWPPGSILTQTCFHYWLEEKSIVMFQGPARYWLYLTFFEGSWNISRVYCVLYYREVGF